MAENKKKSTGKKPVFNFYWIYIVIIVVLILLALFRWDGGIAKTTYSEFRKEMLYKDHVKDVTIVDEARAEISIQPGHLDDAVHKNKINKSFGGSSEGPHYEFMIVGKESFVDSLINWEDKYNITYSSRHDDHWGREMLSWVLLFGLMIGVWIFIMRRVSGGGGPGGQIFNIGKSKAQLFDKTKGTNVTFNDVAGLEGAKEEVQEIVDFLKHPKKYTVLGAKIPKGALLVGPPGTGKTLLAKAVAGEAKVPFFSLSGSDFVEMFVGVGASRVRDLFKQAKEKAPAIIFIDEIDAIGRARGKNPNMGSNDERENTLNQLLTEMDGFGTNSGVIILAATNRADILDKALMRAGRFDRQIYVDMPDINERKEIFEVHLKPLKLSGDLDRNFLAKQTPGFSGADIANICNEAALIAARKGKKAVEKQDFLDAVDRIIGGLEKKNKIISDDEKKAIAYHEAGHATVSWLLEHANPLVKVTIVPRGQSLGAAWYLPEERQITRTAQMLDEMCSLLAGRAAEKVVFDQISTGALSDLERTTKMAQAMVTIYGLNEKLGNISYYDSSGQQSFVMDKPYSDDTAKLIDEEISTLVEGQYERAIKILTENRDKLNKLAEQLLEKEVIFRDDLEVIFGKRPFEKDDTTDDNAKEISKEMKANSESVVPDIPAVGEITPLTDSSEPAKDEADKAEDSTDKTGEDSEPKGESSESNE
ncbi:MAG: ATP-dependent metalloprotease FtsH [Parvicellaceae bacterium]|jgi:ATP-dependent metalloprotease FtsH